MGQVQEPVMSTKPEVPAAAVPAKGLNAQQRGLHLTDKMKTGAA